MPSKKVRDLTDIRNGSDEVRTHNHHHEDGACCCGHHHHEQGDECGHGHSHEPEHKHGHDEACGCGEAHTHEEHEHDANKEIMVIYDGEGQLLSNGIVLNVQKGDIMGFDFNEPHGFINIGTTPLKILWIYHPPGVADEKFLVE